MIHHITFLTVQLIRNDYVCFGVYLRLIDFPSTALYVVFQNMY